MNLLQVPQVLLIQYQVPMETVRKGKKRKGRKMKKRIKIKTPLMSLLQVVQVLVRKMKK